MKQIDYNRKRKVDISTIYLKNICTIKTLVLLLLVVLLEFSCQKDNYIPVSNIELETSHLIMKEGEVKKIEYTILPIDATYKNVRWSSNNLSVVDINNGVIHAVGIGTTSIIVTSEDNNITDVCSTIVR